MAAERIGRLFGKCVWSVGIVVPTLNAKGAFRMGHPAELHLHLELAEKSRSFAYHPQAETALGAPCPQDDRFENKE